jgi:ABC-type lipoprotein release transport system permease subunit
MAAVWYRFRAELRTRWRSWLGLALVVGLAGGAVLGLAAGARRTDTAYERFLTSHRGYDVLVINNPGTFGGEGGGTALLDLDEVRALPEVADAAPVGTFFVTIGAGVGAFVTPDDYVGTELNEFRMLEGRPVDPERPDEAVVSFTFADQYDLGVGDEFDIIPPSFRDAYEAYRENPESAEFDDVDADFAAGIGKILEVLPDGKATIVGIEASPGEFPPQIEGSGRYLIHMSPALYPLRTELAGASEGGDSLLIRLDRGARDTDSFLRHLEELGGGEVPDIVVARELNKSAQRSFRTQAVALWLLALLTAIAGVLVIGQLLARLTSIESGDNLVLAAMGATRTQRAALALCRATAIGVVAAVIAAALAIAVSPAFPTGLARTAEPDPGLRFDMPVTLVGVLGLVVVVVALTAWPAWRSSRALHAVESLPGRTTIAARFLSPGSVPAPIGSGVRMALAPGRGSTSVPVRTSMAGIALGIATLVAALTFAASLAHLLATPRLYGHTWDVELTTYDRSMIVDGLPVLEDDDRVVGIAQGDFRFPFTVDGAPVDGFAMDTVSGELSPVLLEGRTPQARDEIALGTKTLRSLGIGVGDSVEVGLRATRRDPVTMQVVGRAVFPIFAEASSLGEGAFTTLDAAKFIRGEPLGTYDQGVLVRVDSPNLVDAVVENVEAALPFEDELFVIEQGKPTDIVNFGRVEATPYLLGAVLAALSAATLAYVLVSAIRRRRRELAILKTLGFERGQVRATVGWQATTYVVIALLIGVPIGLAVGRWVWDLFANELGVVSEPQFPWLGVALVIPAALVIANLVAAVPAAVAARTRPAIVLRSE